MVYLFLTSPHIDIPLLYNTNQQITTYSNSENKFFLFRQIVTINANITYEVNEMDRPTKLLIVDNNIDFTTILSKIISSDPRIEIVGFERSEAKAYKLLESPNPLMYDVMLTRMFPGTPSVTSVSASLESRITHILNMLGVPAHLKGFHYARKAIAVKSENNESVCAVTKVIYPYVAKIYNTTPSRVERAIRHAIELAWERCTTEILQTIFRHFTNCEKRKPTNSEFIASITDHLQLQSLDE